jgi:pectate lyase
VERVSKSYCDQIPKAPASTALGNGDADRVAYERTRALYHYSHDVRAFLRVADNLYLGSTRAVLRDYHAEQVPRAPYCMTYRHPTPALADRIRREAGDTAAEGESPAPCAAAAP